jgi:hypothetical protein
MEFGLAGPMLDWSIIFFASWIGRLRSQSSQGSASRRQIRSHSFSRARSEARSGSRMPSVAEAVITCGAVAGGRARNTEFA